MQRAEMTAFTDATGALSTKPGWLETWLTSSRQHFLIIIDDIRTFTSPLRPIKSLIIKGNILLRITSFTQTSMEAFACFDKPPRIEMWLNCEIMLQNFFKEGVESPKLWVRASVCRGKRWSGSAAAEILVWSAFWSLKLT